MQIVVVMHARLEPLGAPPPEPPLNVPSFPENKRGQPPKTLRARLEQHRANPVCASCHAMMDPLGLSLENFDAVGKWRTLGESGATVDATGMLPDGTRFQGPAGLRQALLSSDRFVSTLTEKMLTYALGRGLEYYDAPSVRAIVRGAKGAPPTRSRSRSPTRLSSPGKARLISSTMHSTVRAGRFMPAPPFPIPIIS